MTDLIAGRENLTSLQLRRPARSCSQNSKTRKMLTPSRLYGVANNVCVCENFSQLEHEAMSKTHF